MAGVFTTPKKQLTWLITGCSSGFGLSLTRYVQSVGHRVIATSRNPSRTPDLVAEVEAKGGKWLQLDVTDSNSGKLVAELEKSGEEVDVLVNNAGFSIYAPIEVFAEDEIRAQMESMYFGPLRLIQAVLPYMRKRRFGVIVNISSGASLSGRESMGAYAGAKAGLDGMTRVLSKEIEPFNIRTLTVILGTFNTNMGNVALLSKNPLPDDYKGSVADQTMDYMGSGRFAPSGNKDKAMKALFEVVSGTGVGAGHEAEQVLPLGSDVAARVQGVGDFFSHSLEVFGAVTDGVKMNR